MNIFEDYICKTTGLDCSGCSFYCGDKIRKEDITKEPKIETAEWILDFMEWGVIAYCTSCKSEFWTSGNNAEEFRKKHKHCFNCGARMI